MTHEAPLLGRGVRQNERWIVRECIGRTGTRRRRRKTGFERATARTESRAQRAAVEVMAGCVDAVGGRAAVYIQHRGCGRFWAGGRWRRAAGGTGMGRVALICCAADDPWPARAQGPAVRELCRAAVLCGRYCRPATAPTSHQATETARSTAPVAGPAAVMRA